MWCLIFPEQFIGTCTIQGIIFHYGTQNYITFLQCSLMLLCSLHLTSSFLIQQFCMSVSHRESPWEAIGSWACNKILSMLLNPNVNYCVHKSMPLIPVLARWLHPVYDFQSYVIKIHCKIIVPVMPRCSKWSISQLKVLYIFNLLWYPWSVPHYILLDLSTWN